MGKRRPVMASEVQPESTKCWANSRPRPEPPPVIKTTLPAVESSGRLIEMVGYVVVWYVDIPLGIGNAIFVSRMGRFVMLGLENGVAFGRSAVIAVESTIGMYMEMQAKSMLHCSM
jgi:hypothetical protein